MNTDSIRDRTAVFDALSEHDQAADIAEALGWPAERVYECLVAMEAAGMAKVMVDHWNGAKAARHWVAL